MPLCEIFFGHRVSILCAELGHSKGNYGRTIDQDVAQVERQSGMVLEAKDADVEKRCRELPNSDSSRLGPWHWSCLSHVFRSFHFDTLLGVAKSLLSHCSRVHFMGWARWGLSEVWHIAMLAFGQAMRPGSRGGGVQHFSFAHWPFPLFGRTPAPTKPLARDWMWVDSWSSLGHFRLNWPYSIDTENDSKSVRPTSSALVSAKSVCEWN